MSVLDQSYRRWNGQPTSHLQRALVIPRYDLQEVLSRRAWLFALAASLVPPVILGFAAWLAANAETLKRLLPQFPSDFAIPAPGAGAYSVAAGFQCWCMLVFAFLAGPPLATRDFANNAIPLFLSKSLRRIEYLAGRWAVLLLLLSLASWVPLVAVLGVEAAMLPAAWRAENAWLAGAVVLGTLPLALLLTLLTSALGAHVHRTQHVRVALLGLLLGTMPVAAVLSAASDTPAFRALSPLAVAARLREEAFVPPSQREQDRQLRGMQREGAARRGGRPVVMQGSTDLSLGAALLTIAGWLAACGAVLWWRVRPVEVVR